MTIREISHDEYLAGLQNEIQTDGLIVSVRKRLDEINYAATRLSYADCMMVREKSAEIMDMLAAQEPMVMTKEEIKDYLDDPDGDKKPLWLEWHSIPALSGWVLASQVSDLMKRYMDSYNNTWRPWTSRPTDEQRKAVKWG